MTRKDFSEVALDAVSWHPKNKNFEILEWEKFLASNPAPPEIFDPPQRYAFYSYIHSLLLWWGRRSPICQPCGLICHSCCGPLPDIGKLDEDQIFNDMLGPSPDSSKIPEPFRNSLFWTDYNSISETLISMNRWSWRSQTEEGRVIGLGNALQDWSRDATCFGFMMAKFIAPKTVAQIQMSPDGKWYALSHGTDPHDVETEVDWIFFYVVQEGDTFKDRDGNTIDYLKPGDFIRCTWNKKDPYDTTSLTYYYHPRRVATYNEETGKVETDNIHHKALVEKVTKKEDFCWLVKTGCGCCGCCWCVGGEERYDHDVEYLCNRQAYKIAPSPVMGDEIERL